MKANAFALPYQTLQTIFIASLVVALGAQVAIPIGPVPITLQSLVILCLGFLLGPRVGFFSVLAYLIEGAVGFPVFAEGKAGLMVLLGPTSGYLLALPFAVLITGVLYQYRLWQNSVGIVLICLLASAWVLACGTLYLSHFIGLNAAFMFGFKPFIGIEVAKALLISALVIGYHRLKA